MEIYVKIALISTFSIIFWFSIMILSHTLILLMSQLQTEQVMTSQIRSHIEYLIQSLHTCAHFIIKIDEKCSRTGGFNTI